MGSTAVLKFGIAVAAVLVVVGIIYGTLQAEEEFNDKAEIVLATSTPTVVAVLQPEATPEPAYPPAPPREYALTGSDLLLQVRGGDDACRYLYTNNRTSAFSGVETGLWFVAGTWEMDLAASDEMHLYGPNGPHRFYFKDSTGQATAMVDVPRGATVYQTMTFESGVYYLYNRLAPALGPVAEIVARPMGQAGSAVETGWCPS